MVNNLNIVMQETIFRFDPSSEYYTEERCYINELSNSTQDNDVSIAQARVLPGITTCWHRLRNTVERYVILAGNGRVEVGELTPQNITVGDVVLIPANCRQRITNPGNSDLLFLAICSPRFSMENYEVIDE